MLPSGLDAYAYRDYETMIQQDVAKPTFARSSDQWNDASYRGNVSCDIFRLLWLKYRGRTALL